MKTNLRNSLALTLSLFIALVALGCGGGEKALIGTWKGSGVTSANNGGAQNDMQAQLAKSMAGAMSITFNADHTYKMTVLFQIEGTWSMSGSKVSLIATKIMGNAVSGSDAKTENMELSSDGKTLTMSGGSGASQGSITFTKS